MCESADQIQSVS